MSFYVELYAAGDSSFETAIAENQVLDWADDDSTKKTFAHRAEIRDYQYGISFQGRRVGDVLFSVNVKSTDEEWPLARGYRREVPPLCRLFHARANRSSSRNLPNQFRSLVIFVLKLRPRSRRACRISRAACR
jgi:hypothetical protein